MKPSSTFEFLWYAGGFHWLPLALGSMFLVWSLLRRLKIFLPGAHVSRESWSWLVLTIWALQANSLVYELIESPHALIHVGVLFPFFRDILGSLLVGAGLILLEPSAAWIANETPGDEEPSGKIRKSKQARRSILLLIFSQVFINAWLTMIAVLELAVANLGIPP